MPAAAQRPHAAAPPPGVTERREIRALLRDPDVRVRDVARRYGVSRSTLYNYLGAAPARAPAEAGSGR